MESCKGVGPVVAVALLIVVSVVAVIGFQNWYGTFQSKTFSDIEIKVKEGSSRTNIEGVIGNQLYFKNYLKENLTIKEIKIGTKVCNISQINFSLGINNISLGNCTSNLTSQIQDLVVITENNVFEKKHLFKDITIANQVIEELVENPIVQALQGNDANTVLLIHSDGNYKTQEFRNVANPYPVFNQSYLYLDGSGDYLEIPDSDDWSFGNDDYTIDFRINFKQVPARGGIIEQYWPNQADPDYSRGWTLSYQSSKLYYNTQPSTCGFFVIDWIPNTNEWYHLSIVRYNNNLSIYLNGNILNSTDISSCTGMNNPTQPLKIGVDYTSSQSPYYAEFEMDELRITKGVARYTSNFTLPTEIYTAQAEDVLLMHFDQGEGSTSFLDSSNSAHTITVQGNSVQKDVIQVNGDVKHKMLYVEPKFGNSSGYFDGVGDNLEIVDHADWNFGSGDFTIDMWVYPIKGASHILQQRSGAYNSVGINFNIHTMGGVDCWTAAVYNGNNYYGSSDIVPVEYNKWSHLSLVRNGAQVKAYLNGNEMPKGYANDDMGTIAMNDPGTPLYISWDDYWDDYEFNGYIDELRISKGIARWTENFTVPTEPHTKQVEDVLLMHFDEGFESQSFTDVSDTPHTITTNGDTKQTSKRFNSDFAGYFDGDGDYLEVENSNAVDFGTEDFTIDFWFYTDDSLIDTVQRGVLSIPLDGYPTRKIGIYQNHVYFYYEYPASGTTTYGGWTTQYTDLKNKWTHLAFVRKNGVFKAYCDGKNLSLTDGVENWANIMNSNSTLPILIGASYQYDNVAPNIENFDFKIDELRISKGIARWTSDFIPPTQPYIQDEYTKLLLHFDPETNYTAFKDSSSSNHNIVKNGNTTIVRKYPFNDSAIYFDGTGDYLTLEDSDDWDFGSENFTIDFWIKTLDSAKDILSTYEPIDNINSYLVYISSGGKLSFYENGGIVNYGFGKINDGIWHHCAIIREKGILYYYIDGILNGNISDGNYLLNNSGTQINIGNSIRTGVSQRELEGYLDELRISKGIVRWNDTFLPPGGPYK